MAFHGMEQPLLALPPARSIQGGVIKRAFFRYGFNRAGQESGAGMGRSDIKCTAFIKFIILSNQIVPIEITQQSPGGDGTDIYPTLPRRVSGPPCLDPPAQLLLTVPSQMNFSQRE